MKEKEKDAKRLKRQRTTELALKEGRDANMNEDERKEEEDARVDPYEMDDGLGGDVGADEMLNEEEEDEEGEGEGDANEGDEEEVDVLPEPVAEPEKMCNTTSGGVKKDPAASTG